MGAHSNRHTLAFLFTTFPPEVTGSAYYNWERVKWLARHGDYRIVVLAPDWQGKVVLPTVPEECADRLIIEPYPSKPWLIYNLLQVPTFSAANQIRDCLARYQPDLITVVDIERLFWFGTWHLPGRNYARKHQIPYITEYHTDYYSHLGTYAGGKWIRELFLKPINQYLYHQCDQSIAVSASSSKGLQNLGVTNARLIRIYGLSLSMYSPARRDRKWFEPWLTPAEQDHKVILFLGRIASEKRVDVLIEAFAELKTRYRKCSLIIVGDGPAEVVQKLRRLAEPVDNIHFTGFIQGEMKANLLASCDVYCSPAPHETFGLTIVEAMASGVPVVTVKSGGVAEYVVDGVNGYLIPPNDSEKLARGIENVLISDNATIVEQGLRSTHELSLEKGCENLDDYYQELWSQISSLELASTSLKHQ